jgi:hypothetical protein
VNQPSISICSCLRSDAPYARAYFNQLRSFRCKSYRIAAVHVVCDDPDALAEVVRQTGAGAELPIRLIREVSADRNCTSMAAKARQWAVIGNQALDAAAADGTTHVLWLDADLCVPYDAVDILLARGKDLIAPLINLGGSFYDSFAFRDLNGDKIFGFNGIDMAALPEPVELASAGGCVLMTSGVLASGIRFRGVYEGGLLAGLCNDARASGYRVFADPMVMIVHPTLSWLEQIHIVQNVRAVDGLGRCHEIAPNCVLASLHDESVISYLGQVLDSGALPIAPGSYSLRIVSRPDRTRTLELRSSAGAAAVHQVRPGWSIQAPIERISAAA